LRRRKAYRDPVPFILVVSEGRNTEPQYIDGFRQFYANRLVRVHRVDGAGVPITVVEEAMRAREEASDLAKRDSDDNLLYDEAWCLFDVDEHPGVEEAIAMAAANNISVAVSNPCFELWLLLHFKEHSAHIERKASKKLLLTHVSDYDKNVNFHDYRDGYDLAVTRATGLDKRAESIHEPGKNPTTGVYHLTERIRSFGRH